MRRRDFLLGSLVSPWVAGCASLKPDRTNWSSLGRVLDGDLLLPGDATYDINRKIFNTRFDDIRPAAVARCTTVDDVRACVDFARSTRLPVHVRSGGHSYAGWSTGPGLVIDVSQMNRVSVPAGSTAATVGAGAKLIDVYDALAARGRTFPGGSCPTVGIAGFTMGGGISMLGRAYGMGCDNLQQVEIVTASGDVLTCDAETHRDLYWACRGGGGGNFGIATSFQLQTHPLRNITTLRLEWDWRLAAQVMKSWQRWGPQAPDEAWSNCRFQANPAGPRPRVIVTVVFLGEAADLEPMLGDLIQPVRGEPNRTAETMEGLYAMLTLAGCPTMTVQQCHLSLTSKDGTLNRPAHVAKSTFFDRPLNDHTLDAAIHHIEAGRTVPGLSQAGIIFDAFGGAIGRVNPGETAFAHRRSLFSAQLLAYWSDNADRATPARCTSWIRDFHADVRDGSTGGAYVNYTDPELGDWAHAYYGSNYERLVRVKAAYDPKWIFKMPQGIPVA